MSEDSTTDAANDTLELGKLVSDDNDRAELYASLEG